jgi:adenylosuccinate synthase
LDRNSVEEYVAFYKEFTYKVNLVDETFLSDRIQGKGVIIFEGAQGVLLDQNYGFFPYVTRGNTTQENIDALVGSHPYTKLGILRTFFTRHGAGPFPTECPLDTFCYDRKVIQRDHNKWGPWQQNFRLGYFDMALARYAIQRCQGIDALGLTWTDAFQQPAFVANYEEDNLQDLFKCTPMYTEAKSFPHFQHMLEAHLRITTKLYSHGPTAEDKIWKPSLLGL